MSRALALLLLSALALGLAACASDTTASGRPQESTIPWNRPQKWEGPGVYGSAMGQGY
jgi:hypothetical protein